MASFGAAPKRNACRGVEDGWFRLMCRFDGRKPKMFLAQCRSSNLISRGCRCEGLVLSRWSGGEGLGREGRDESHRRSGTHLHLACFMAPRLGSASSRSAGNAPDLAAERSTTAL